MTGLKPDAVVPRKKRGVLRRSYTAPIHDEEAYRATPQRARYSRRLLRAALKARSTRKSNLIRWWGFSRNKPSDRRKLAYDLNKDVCR